MPICWTYPNNPSFIYPPNEWDLYKWIPNPPPSPLTKSYWKDEILSLLMCEVMDASQYDWRGCGSAQGRIFGGVQHPKFKGCVNKATAPLVDYVDYSIPVPLNERKLSMRFRYTYRLAKYDTVDRPAYGKGVPTYNIGMAMFFQLLDLDGNWTPYDSTNTSLKRGAVLDIYLSGVDYYAPDWVNRAICEDWCLSFSKYDNDYHGGHVRGQAPNINQWYVIETDLGKCINDFWNKCALSDRYQPLLRNRGIQVYTEGIGCEVKTEVDWCDVI